MEFNFNGTFMQHTDNKKHIHVISLSVDVTHNRITNTYYIDCASDERIAYTIGQIADDYNASSYEGVANKFGKAYTAYIKSIDFKSIGFKSGV